MPRMAIPPHSKLWGILAGFHELALIDQTSNTFYSEDIKKAEFAPMPHL